MASKKPYHQIVAERLIAQLKAGTAPWQKPWSPGLQSAFLPTNPTTGKRYKGINAIYLASQGRDDSRWMTYRQAEAAGAQVRKGERGTAVQYWKFHDEQPKLDASGKPVHDAEGKPLKVTITLERPRVFFATVFNAEQIDGLAPLERKEQTWDGIERAERILSSSGADIRHGAGGAYYRLATDSVHLPDKGAFETADRYYATALHELGHWTGHPSRLDRDLSHPFGSEQYAREELRAEIASLIVGEQLGIGHDPEQHAAYVGSWIKVLEEDPMEIFRAAADAERIQDYVLAFEQTQVQEQRQQEAGTNMPTPTNIDGLPGRLVDRLANNGIMSRPDAVLTSALRDLRSGTDATKRIDIEALNEASQTAFGFTLPPDWSGEVQVQGNVIEDDGSQQNVTAADALGVEPQFHGVYARREDGTHQWLADFDREQQADEVAQRLVAISAHARGRLDPNNTAEGIPAGGAESREGANPDTQVEGILTALESAGWTRGDGTTIASKPFHTVNGRNDALAFISNGDGINRTLQFRYTSEGRNVVAADGALIPVGATAEQATELATVAAARAEQSIQQSFGVRIAAMLDVGSKQPEPEAAADQRQYITVPFKEKAEAKQLGARWDRQQQSWYVPHGVDAAPFAKWAQEAAAVAAQLRAEQQAPEPSKEVFHALKQAARDGDERAIADLANTTAAQGRTYLAVPYDERGAAKAAGALWDKSATSWYVGPKADPAALTRWALDNARAQQDPAMPPREEFEAAMRDAGLIVGNDGRGNFHPIMDGNKHRVAVVGGKKGAVDGFYVAHLDGHPAGRIINNKTGADIHWKSKGYALSDQEKSTLHAEAAAKLAERAAEQDRLQEATAQRVGRQMIDLVPVEHPTPYMQVKGIEAHAGVFTDREGQKTYIPAYDVDGKQWTMQYIQEDGTKRFAKDSRKEGTFHVVGGRDTLAAAPVIAIFEGYATAASSADVLGFSTVAAFDSGNLDSVAKALRERYPDKPILIGGDDDKALALTHGTNAGRTKAEAAADAVGGLATFPIFAASESNYPAWLAPVTPAAFKAGELTDSQLAAIDRMKGFTDFNDLATKSEFGREGLVRQLQAAVGQAHVHHRQQRREQEQAEAQVVDPPRRSARVG